VNNFTFINPKEAVEKKLKFNGEERPLEFWEKIANQKSKLCCACGNYPEWKLAGTGLCFSCATGKWDASNDYELKEE